MAVTLIRAVILYVAVVFMIRLMGKRQIGELQPSELAATILVSEIASIPMQDNSIPILNSVIALLVLVAFEIISSAIALKSPKMRSYIQGHPVIVIRDGTIDYKALKKLRMSVNDLVSALRQKDVFDFNQISYAVFETNGKISVLLKPEYRNSTASDLDKHPEDNGMPFAVICDGEMLEDIVKDAGYTKTEIKKMLVSNKIPIDKILILSVDSGGVSYLARKDDGQ